MALKDLIQKIKAEAEKEADLILSQAEPEIEQVQNSGAAEKASALAQVESNAKSALGAAESKMQAMARRESQQAGQYARREVLDKALASFLKSLDAADAARKTPIFKKLLERCGAGSSAIYRVNAADKKVLEPLVKSGEIREDQGITSGFVIEENGALIDCTFESLVMSECRPDLEIYFAERLKLTS